MIAVSASIPHVAHVAGMPAILLRAFHIAPVWRNWQTHRTQNAADLSMPVRVRPPAPPKDTDIDTMSVFFLFAVSSVEDANIG